MGPKGLLWSPLRKKLLVADFFNHRIRSVVLTNQTATTTGTVEDDDGPTTSTLSAQTRDLVREGVEAQRHSQIQHTSTPPPALPATSSVRKSISCFTPRICSRTLIGYSDPPPEGGGGVGAPHQCSLGAATCYLLVMLTCAVLMTSSHSEGT